MTNEADTDTADILDLESALKAVYRRLNVVDPEFKATLDRAARELTDPNRPPGIPIDLDMFEVDLLNRIKARCRKDNIEKMTREEAWKTRDLLDQMRRNGECWSSLLPHGDRAHDLWHAAEKAAKNAYAPYSNFHVGAAILTASGKIFAGCNVESADYDGTHAEESALAAMVCAGERSLIMLATVVLQDGEPYGKPVTPCGKCRQKLVEFAQLSDYDLDVIQRYIALAMGREYEIMKLSKLIPNAFGPRTLGKVK